MWRSTFRRPQSWALVLRTGVYQKLLSGLTLSSSMASRGAALWISSLADFPAPTSPSPESKPESKGNTPGSGLNTSASFARFDQNSCLLRTSRQFSLFPQEQPYLEGLPKAGSMRSGYLFERPTWKRPIAESACSSWPTPCSQDQGRTEFNANNRIDQGHQADLSTVAAIWPSPRSEDSEACGNHPGATDSLTGATREWRTPKSRDHHAQGPRPDATQRQTDLADQAQSLWQTPATDSFHSRGGDRKDEMGLDQQARSYPTPSARDWKDGRASEETTESNARPLNEFVLNEMENWPTPRVTTSAMEPSEAQLSRIRSGEESERGAGACKLEISASLFSRPDPPTPQDGADSSPITPGSRRPSARKKLNAYFVEMLMGLPPGWTSMLPLGQIDSER